MVTSHHRVFVQELIEKVHLFMKKKSKANSYSCFLRDGHDLCLPRYFLPEGSIHSLEVTFVTGIFCFHVVEPLMAILALLPTLCIMEKLEW